MLQILLCIIFIALILLIIRVSELNKTIASISDHMSDYATVEYVNEILKYKPNHNFEESAKDLKPK